MVPGELQLIIDFLFAQQTYSSGTCQHGEHLQSFEGSDCYVF